MYQFFYWITVIPAVFFALITGFHIVIGNTVACVGLAVFVLLLPWGWWILVRRLFKTNEVIPLKDEANPVRKKKIWPLLAKLALVGLGILAIVLGFFGKTIKDALTNNVTTMVAMVAPGTPRENFDNPANK